MNKIIVTGGKQKKGLNKESNEWNYYEEAIIASMDTNGKNEKVEITYKTPEGVTHNDDPSYVFKAGSVYKSILNVCTNTEILGYRLPDFKLQSYVSHKYFNDVHHVLQWKNDYLVVSTGLDMLLHIDNKGNLLNQWNIVPNENPDTWERFQKDIDYRKVPSTKPHTSHPNYVFIYNNDIWVTRLIQKDAICITDKKKKIGIDVERVHDGKIYKNKAYFTTVDGHMVITNMETLKTEKIINFNNYNDCSSQTLGWCRGIEILNSNQILVGFSRLRPTKIKENLKWVKSKIQKGYSYGHQKTRICLFDIKEDKLTLFSDLEKLSINAVFSINKY